MADRTTALGATARKHMAFDLGLGNPETCYMRSFRWMFLINGVSGAAKALPPVRGSRPSFEFKEQMVAHLVENIYYPIRVEWKPIQLTLYEIRHDKAIARGQNPVFTWINQLYDGQTGKWSFIHKADECNDADQAACFKRNALLVMYDGCGAILETWQLDNVWPQSVNWGSLDMASSDVVTVEISLRYDRAFLLTEGTSRSREQAAAQERAAERIAAADSSEN